MNGPNRPGMLFRCKYCQFIFQTAADLVSHKRSDHADEILKIVSVTGNYRPPQTSTLPESSSSSSSNTAESQPVEVAAAPARNYPPQDSIRSRPGGQARANLQCRFCGKRLNRKRNLIYHERIHTGEKPHVCQYCSKAFIQKGQVVRHEKKCSRTQKSRTNHVSTTVRDKKPAVYSNGSDSHSHRSKQSESEDHPKVQVTSSSSSSSPRKSCKICGESFTFNIQLKVHERSHAKQSSPSHKCSSCNIRFPHAESLRLHQKFCPAKRKQTSEPSSAGSQDSESSDNNDRREDPDYGKRKRKSRETKILVCGFCRKNFHCRSTLERHLRVHTGEKPYTCDLCDQRFALKSDVKKHQSRYLERGTTCAIAKALKPPQNQTGIPNSNDVKVRVPYHCQSCPRTFKFPSELNRHQERSHGKKPTSVGDAFKMVIPVKSDVERVLATKASQLRFSTISKAIISSSSSSSSAAPDGSHTCPICHRVFSTKNNLRVHMHIHVGAKPYRCTKCNFRTNNSGTLSRHKRNNCSSSSRSQTVTNPTRTHVVKSPQPTVIAPLKKIRVTSELLPQDNPKDDGYEGKNCRYCRKICKSRTDRLTHERVHTGERPFPCSYCSRRFTQPGHRNFHQQTCCTARPAGLEDPLSSSVPTPVPKNDQVATESISDESSLGESEHLIPARDGSRSYPCPVCSKIFPGPSKLRIHMNIHTGRKPFRCHKCGMRFNNPGSVASHSQRCDTGNPPRTSPAQISLKKSPSKPPSSVSPQRSTTPFKINSEGSNQSVRYVPYLTRISRPGERISYSCNFCGKLVPNRTDAAKHVRVHVGRKPYCCPHCDHKFEMSHQVMRHELLAHPESSHVGVEKEVPRGRKISHSHKSVPGIKSVSLKKRAGGMSRKIRRPDVVAEKYAKIDIHYTESRSDTGRMLFRCSLCSKTFPQRQYIREHVMFHTKSMPHQCELCGGRFIRPYRLRIHMARVHKQGIIGVRRNKHRKPLPNPEPEEEDSDENKEEENCAENTDENSEENCAENTDENSEENPENNSTLTLSPQQRSAMYGKVMFNFKQFRKCEEKTQGTNDEETIRSGVKQMKTGVKARLKQVQRKPGWGTRNEIRLAEVNAQFTVKIIRGIRSFECNICKKILLRKGNAREHVMRHTGLKPWECDQCEQSFIRPCLLREHRMAAHGWAGDEKNGDINGVVDEGKCPECSLRYDDPHVMENHRAGHRDKLPFLCLPCGRWFRIGFELKQHAKLH